MVQNCFLMCINQDIDYFNMHAIELCETIQRKRFVMYQTSLMKNLMQEIQEIWKETGPHSQSFILV